MSHFHTIRGYDIVLVPIKDSEIVILSVLEERNSMLDMFFGSEVEESDLKKKVTDRLNKIAIEYKEKYQIEVETMVAKGCVYEKICEVADMVNASLIVMGTNGAPKGISKKFIGSNAERVVRYAQCPVVTI